MSTQTHDETLHPRATDGRFTAKAVTEADGGLDALAVHGASVGRSAPLSDRPGVLSRERAPVLADAIDPSADALYPSQGELDAAYDEMDGPPLPDPRFDPNAELDDDLHLAPAGMPVANGASW